MQHQTPAQTPRSSPSTARSPSHPWRWHSPDAIQPPPRSTHKFSGVVAPVRINRGLGFDTPDIYDREQLPSPDSSPNLRFAFPQTTFPSSSFNPSPLESSSLITDFDFSVNWGPPVIPPHSQITEYSFVSFDQNTNAFPTPFTVSTPTHANPPSHYVHSTGYGQPLHSSLHQSKDYSTSSARPTHISTPPFRSISPFPVAALREREKCTLLLADIDNWMDVEYVSQLCDIMEWEDVEITVPPVIDPNRPDPSSVDAGTGGRNVTGSTLPNNPGHCFLTFPTQDLAAQALDEVGSSNKQSLKEQQPALLLPNSPRPLNISWAPPGSLAAAITTPSQTSTSQAVVSTGYTSHGPYIRGPEFSIFVGDLAPETTNHDLVAVFRDPTLGLRPDREPRAIRPFLSCKGAKIMSDPVTGLSKGYGFVRFTDEADMQRALIEMQGLYCMSRPMRISHATAKAKAAATQPRSGQLAIDATPHSSSGPHLTANATPSPTFKRTSSNITKSSPTSKPASTPADVVKRPPRSVSSPIANSSSNDNHSLANTSMKVALSEMAPNLLAKVAKIGGEAIAALKGRRRREGASPNPSGVKSEEVAMILKELEQTIDEILKQPDATKAQLLQTLGQYQAEARAVFASANLGPNGGVLNSTDPYNTTVFIGGLSGLISEETLKTFFAPFGEIHYVKIPPGKGCGFVQFVRKLDAERAIQKMQGFPIGGGRIRLSWGRSQSDKAAQAAAQAAHQGLNLGGLGSLNGLSLQQAASLFSNTAGAITPSASATSAQFDTSPSDPSYARRAIGYDPKAFDSQASLSTIDTRESGRTDSLHSLSSTEIGSNGSIGRLGSYPSWSNFSGRTNQSNDSITTFGSTISLSQTAPGLLSHPPGSEQDIKARAQEPFESMQNAFTQGRGGISHIHHPSAQYQSNAAGFGGSRGFQANDILRQEQAMPHYSEAPHQQQQADPPRYTVLTARGVDLLAERFASMNAALRSPPAVVPGSALRQTESHGQINPYSYGDGRGGSPSHSQRSPHSALI